MSVSENFDRKFNRSMRGYNTEEVDAAIDALLRYCDELEDANREFQIANNDLIDTKTELNGSLDTLKAENDDLTKKLRDMTDRLKKVEDVYNGYRAKFGEARDLVNAAKASADDIIAKAEARKLHLVREAEAQKSRILSELDNETEKRRALIDRLDVCYNKFSESLKNNLKDMLHKVEDFNVMPILGNENSFESKKSLEKESIFDIPEEIPTIEELPATRDIPLIETRTDVTNDKIHYEAEETIPETHTVTEYMEIPIASSPDVIEEDVKIFGKESGYENNSSMSKMKKSLDAIAKKVSAKKSTPHL
ncbi:MAG: DivIVA domain-containing protein [Clostridia bacterium]|nr:DivIVA domain-containing protein [Clostridia bacterium]